MEGSVLELWLGHGMDIWAQGGDLGHGLALWIMEWRSETGMEIWAPNTGLMIGSRYRPQDGLLDPGMKVWDLDVY